MSAAPAAGADALEARPGAGEHRSYYGQPVIKQPVWTAEVPWYFFTGGLAGASAGLAYLAELRGCDVLARRAWASALAGIGVSPLLLISDLGRPARFLHMLRMFKPTSPMSVGSWVLSASGAATSIAAADALFSRLRGPARVAKPAAAALGLPLCTYTGALISQTAVPAWHAARHELPALFAAGAAASAGACATALTPVAHAAPARRLALLGAGAELAVASLIEHRPGVHSEPYRSGVAGSYSRAARAFTAAGALLLGGRGARGRRQACAGASLVLAGAVCERFSVFRAGFQSAADPSHTVGPQRERIRTGRSRGASRRGDSRAAR